MTSKPLSLGSWPFFRFFGSDGRLVEGRICVLHVMSRAARVGQQQELSEERGGCFGGLGLLVVFLLFWVVAWFCDLCFCMFFLYFGPY